MVGAQPQRALLSRNATSPNYARTLDQSASRAHRTVDAPKTPSSEGALAVRPRIDPLSPCISRLSAQGVRGHAITANCLAGVNPRCPRHMSGSQLVQLHGSPGAACTGTLPGMGHSQVHVASAAPTELRVAATCRGRPPAPFLRIPACSTSSAAVDVHRRTRRPPAKPPQPHAVQAVLNLANESGLATFFRTTKKPRAIRALMYLAEREGFEPSIRLLTLYSLSRGAPSASRASLRIFTAFLRSRQGYLPEWLR